nr:SMC family ATPase [Anaerolineae bacterium]
MIPVRLELTNFLAYRTPAPLNLSGLHLACLTGANGAGKSSLLDALTWALWGKARARRDDDLIHTGEQEMQVRLTFAIDNTSYLVSRFRTRKGRGSSELALYVDNNGEWLSIAEPTIRATQDRIIRLLHLNYETFINSALLIQGRADEFTQKPPGERKAILGEILGLNAWAGYEDRVKQRLKQLDIEAQQTDLELARIDENLDKEALYEQQLADAEQELAALVSQVEEAEAKIRELEAYRHRRDSLNLQVAQLQTRIGGDSQEIEQLSRRYEQAQERVEQYQALIARQDEIMASYEILVTARAEDQEYASRLLEQRHLRDQLNAFQNTIDSERSALQSRYTLLTQQQADREKTIAESEDKLSQLEEARERIAAMNELREERERHSDRLSMLREDRAELEATNRALKSEMDALNNQHSQIKNAPEPVCPLCEQELSDQHREDLLKRLTSEGQEKASLYRANQEAKSTLDQELAELRHEIDRLDSELRALPPLQTFLARLENQLEQAKKAREEWNLTQKEIDEIGECIASENYAQDARSGLEEIQQALAEMGYDEQAHKAARATSEEYLPFEAHKQELNHVLLALPEAEERLSELEKQIADKDAFIAEHRQTVESLIEQVSECDRQIEALGHWDNVLINLRDRERQAHYGVGAAQQALKSLEDLRARQDSLTARRIQLADEQGVCEELRLAFGKDGVPAMLIEAAIPEIENEANEILSRMTDGRMHIRFDTQREKVTGGTRETLDILIADELGTRDYETFSGGEAFRVNFAIRLALSRLLARRAGTQLRTLIIDEGFGTQDTQGRERLIQAINAIKDDFDLVLVITHIDELKEAFPARIEITKTPEGSQIEIV